eukprot:SM014032S00711  [mRNA]  locus=s14032:102:245:+ [translate_table: standard]
MSVNTGNWPPGGLPALGYVMHVLSVVSSSGRPPACTACLDDHSDFGTR